MTLTEEQRGTAGFALERARGLRDFLQDDCAEVGDIWGEMIAEIERLRAENEEALEYLTAAYPLGRHEKAQEVAARIKELKDAQNEGKIGNGNHSSNVTKMVWQITDERVEALRGIYNEMVPLNAKSRHLPVLRAMLKKAGQTRESLI